MNKPFKPLKEVTGLGKIPPQAIDLEQAVLGAMMIEKDSIYTVSGILKMDSFYHEKHQNVYSSIVDLFQKGEPVDILTVTQDLRKKGMLEFVGGPLYVTELTSRVNSSANIETHARIIAEMALKRDLIRIASEIEKRCFDDTEDAFVCKDFVDTELSKIDSGIESSKIKSIKDVTASVLTELSEARKAKEGLVGVPSGFTDIDKITGGWADKDLIIIAARASMGKTAFVICCTANAAIRHGKSVAIFSLEMSSNQIVQRMITSELDFLDISTDKIRKGQVSDEQFSAIHANINDLISSKIFIDDTPALSISRLRAKAFYLKRRQHIDLIIVDYLQLMTVDSTNRNSNREQEIASISRGLKTLAKDLNVPVIALSQLSRAVETRGGDKKPMLSDLRESGAIEQDADLVGFLYRPEYYGITEDQQGNNLKGIGLFIIAKHRNGSLDEVPLRFISRHTKFKNERDVEPSSAFNYGGYRDPYKDFEENGGHKF